MIKAIKNKYKNIKYKTEKKRFLKLSFTFGVLIILAIYLITRAYASYVTEATLMADVDKAVYVLDEQLMTFNIDSAKIVPSNDKYSYRFTIANFDATRHSEVDLEYKLKVRTTTNLPITLELYRNQLPTATGATNILGSPTLRQDVDGAWYRVYSETTLYEMDFNEDVTDVYTLLVNFPKQYADDTTYADVTENISIIIESKQIL